MAGPSDDPHAGAVGARDPDAADRWRRIDRLAHVMDSSIRVPGTDRRIGADGLLGLIPGVGDVATLGVAGLVVVEGIRLGARGSTLTRMLLNVAIDALIGAVPLLGWVGDVAFKANSRNVRLLREHALDPRRTQEESRRRVWLTVAALVLLVVVVVALVIGLVAWLLSLMR